MRFRRLSSREVWKGSVVAVREDRFVFDDGEEVEREVVAHPGAVAVVAHDGEQVYLVAHAREAVDEPELLELPAGKLDHDGESPLETGQRELAEEIGKCARSWECLTTCYSSPGFTDEQVHVYLATDLYDADTDRDESERIELRPVPLTRLDATIRECRDAKTLVGLLWLRAFGGTGIPSS
jgi:8-oxo-dGTP pyrophosphatase MutT (NUDIX family)